MERINLFCLPFAGGSKYAYRGYAKAAPAALNVIPLELPGRGARYKAALLTDMDRIVADVFGQVQDRLDQPYAIYGHSMGTLVGYLLTKRILHEDLPPPRSLFFSGRGGPSLPADDAPYHLLPRPAFLAKIRELGGCPEEVLQDNELMNLFEPILRADFKALETCPYAGTFPFPIPITAMIGADERVSYDDALAWQAETAEPLAVKVFPGNHFFIFNHEAEIMDLVAAQLRAPVRHAAVAEALC